MTKTMLAAGAAIFAVVGASPAFAAKTFTLTAVSNNFTINATVTTTNASNNAGVGTFSGYRVTDITGTIGNNSIAGLVAAGGYESNDNILGVSDPFLDLDGISFTTTGGPSPVNIYYNGSYAYFRGANGNNTGVFTSFTVTPGVAAVPEPATWGMMILGMGAAGYAMRRRKVMVRIASAA